jgi:excisionase family DNA binding protein
MKKEEVRPVSVKHSLYTTHDVSKLLSCDAATVAKWIDKGFILAYRTPGGHRRVQAPHLVAFLKCFGMPIPEVLSAYQNQVLPLPTKQAAEQRERSFGGSHHHTHHTKRVHK